MAGRMSTGRALLTALAGVTAFEGGVPALDIIEMGEEAPGESFSAAVAVAAKLAEEVRRLGGDPDEVRRRIYDVASELAYS